MMHVNWQTFVMAGIDMKRYLILILCAVAINAEAACEGHGSRRVDGRLTIALQEQALEGRFYYRSGHYAIVVDPAPLTRELTRFAENGPLHAGRLLRDVRSTPSGGEAKDLFALVLKDAMYSLSVEWVLANLLERGEASVIDAFSLPNESDRYVSPMVLFKLSGDQAYRGRQFCTPSGELLLEVVDEIA